MSHEDALGIVLLSLMGGGAGFVISLMLTERGPLGADDAIVKRASVVCAVTVLWPIALLVMVVRGVWLVARLALPAKSIVVPTARARFK